MLAHRPLCLAAAISLLGVGSVRAQTGSESTSTASSTESGSGTAAPSATEIAAASSGESGGSLKQKQNGITVALSLITRSPFVQTSGTNSFVGSGIAGELFAGYKLDRFFFGLGFSIDHAGNTTKLASAAGNATTTTESTSFLISPGVQIAALRAASGRLELLGTVQLGLGRAVTWRSDDPALPPTVSPNYPSTNFHLNYQIGPGLRFFFIPQLALQLLSGIEGDHFFASQDAPSGLRADQINTVSLYGKLGLLGVF
jgi:hypothetical protein